MSIDNKRPLRITQKDFPLPNQRRTARETPTNMRGQFSCYYQQQLAKNFIYYFKKQLELVEYLRLKPISFTFPAISMRLVYSVPGKTPISKAIIQNPS